MPGRTGFTLLLAAVLAAVVGCTRPVPPPEPDATPPAPAPAPAPVPAPMPLPAPPVPSPQPEPQPEPDDKALADPERNAVLFTHWRSGRPEVEAFEAFLVHENLARVAPTYQLLRSASMWKECRADPFQLPPPPLWAEVRNVLQLLHELRTRRILPAFEVVSAYRPPALNRCAGGAPGSSHQRFAVDIAPLDDAAAARLCRFWREEGQQWDMGMSRYPSGRIHIDRNGYRTWGASHGRGSSACLR